MKFEIEIDISAIVVMVFETFLSLQLRESNIHEKLILNSFYNTVNDPMTINYIIFCLEKDLISFSI